MSYPYPNLKLEVLLDMYDEDYDLAFDIMFDSPLFSFLFHFNFYLCSLPMKFLVKMKSLGWGTLGFLYNVLWLGCRLMLWQAYGYEANLL